MDEDRLQPKERRIGLSSLSVIPDRQKLGMIKRRIPKKGDIAWIIASRRTHWER